ncbi:hypothetical protein Rcae01_03677 [Novipirellula caenicola]|uniref:ASPIC/UnbV domain-containing protein n=2 Tax=Novipirellula caenicola TaxID=1536901 RepID=A0ABP9VTP9_9BACT
MRRCSPLVLLVLCSVLGGCTDAPLADADKFAVDPVATASAYSRFSQAVSEAKWADASQWSSAALIERPDDPDVLFMAAKVAYHNGDLPLSTELMLTACDVTSYGDDNQVQQTVVALLSMGRLYAAIELLENTTGRRPEHHVFRRQLVDFYAMAERPELADPHRRVLIQQRKFDLKLLLDLAAKGPRTLEEDSVQLLVERNPDDLRPLLAKAKRHFDQRRDEDAASLLGRIIARHPDFVPAHLLAISIAARSGDFDAVMRLATQMPEDVDSDVRYWIALGDWARDQSLDEVAVRCYWEGTRRDADDSECWLKLQTSLQRVDEQRSTPELIAASSDVQTRARLLNRLDQQRREFLSAQADSQRLAIGIAQTLQQLGRLWECEAWAAIALTLTRDPIESAAEYRNSVVATLRRDMPWQVVQGHPELKLDFSHMPLPAIERNANPQDHALLVTSAIKQSGHADSISSLKLVNQAAERGVKFFGYTQEHLDRPGFMLHHTLGCGGGTLDYDLDGWSDVYFAAAGGTPRIDDSNSNALFRNLGGDFRETTSLAGTGDTGFGQGVAVGDVNEDGFPDILVLNFGRNVLYLNQGDGTFEDGTDHWLGTNTETAWSTSGAIVDFNTDGLADLVYLNYCKGEQLTTHRCFAKQLDAAPSCSPMAFPADADVFRIGDAAGHFQPQSENIAAEPDIIGRGLGIVAGALDDNAGIDLFVANDMTNNHYWSTSFAADTDDRLRDFALTRGLAGDARGAAQGSMGIAVGDVDRDGRFDLFVTNFTDESNVLHRGTGHHAWVDDTHRFGLASSSFPLVAFGTQMVDLDNDSRHEIVVTNGHVQILSPSGVRADYEQPFQLYEQNVKGRYELVSPRMQGDYVNSLHVGRALWTIDADRDGMTDLFVTHQTEPVALLMNHSAAGRSWIEFQLVGTSSSRDAIGAVVELQCGDDVWTQPLTSGDGYLCSNERRLRFGLKDSKPSGCSVTIRWPSGNVDSYDDLTPNRRWLIAESQGITQLDH